MKKLTKEIKSKIDNANTQYRLGHPIMSDAEYDSLVEEYGYTPGIGLTPTNKDDFKQKLPRWMGSLDKVKDGTDFNKWIASDDGKDSHYVITPKFDGIAILTVANISNGKLKDQLQFFTRGDGETGVNVTRHFVSTKVYNDVVSFVEQYIKVTNQSDCSLHIVSELVMENAIFAEKWATEYKNTRNMVAGVINRVTPQPACISDMTLRAFDLYDNTTRTYGKTIELINTCSAKLVGIKSAASQKYTGDDYLICMHVTQGTPMPGTALKKWVAEGDHKHVIDSVKLTYDTECDGLVIRAAGHREVIPGQNPQYAIAWKPQVNAGVPTLVKSIEWNTSKEGLLKPVVLVEPIEVGGVTISRVTGYNASFIEMNGIGPGYEVYIVRSGDVIPKIVGGSCNGVSAVLPTECPSCGSKVKYNETEIDLCCNNIDCPAAVLNQIVHFVKTCGIKNIAEGNIASVLDYYSTVNSWDSFIRLSDRQLNVVPGWGVSRTVSFMDELNKQLAGIPIHVLQHATGFFKGLGSTKLEVPSNQFWNTRPSMDDLCNLPGFDVKSAKSYLTGFDAFWKWYETKPAFVGIAKAAKVETASEILKDKGFVFTGFRSAELENIIEVNGGEIQSGVSKKTFMLVTATADANSSKAVKAKSVGALIKTKKEFEEWLKSVNAVTNVVSGPTNQTSASIAELDSIL